MDKLQPVIKHRFWILVALVPPLCIFGYYSANGAMKQATADRITALDGVISAIPPGTGANPTWTDADKGGLAVINAEYKAAVDAELVRVWEEQQERMTWPPRMQQYVPSEYLGEFPQEAGFTYKDEYPDLIAAVHASVEPITPDARGKGFSGKVWLDQKLIPRHQFGQLSVESKKIWEAQEDLWYLQLLFDAIRNVNRSSENAAKAVIRKVYKVDLVGGTGESSVKATATSGQSGMPVQGMEGMHSAEMPMMDMQSGSTNDGPGRTAGLPPPKVGFSPAEEFGSDALQSSQSAAQPTSGPAEMMTMMSGSRGATKERIRYIKLDENAKFRERGFYLSVLIDQKKIADFLVELSNADWPIRIVRFHVGPNPEKQGSATGVMDQYSTMYPGSSSEMPAMEAPTFDAFDPGAFDAYAEPGADTQMQMGPSPLVTSEQMAGLFTHPDLVQLDVCGVITFYNPPKPDLLAAVQAQRESPSTRSSAELPGVEATVDPAGASASSSAADALTAEPGASVEPDSPTESAEPGSATEAGGSLPADTGTPVEPADESEAPTDTAESPVPETPPADGDAATAPPQ